MQNTKLPQNIDEYIARFSEDIQAILAKVRATIRKAAPDAKEVISYQMPAFKQHGILGRNISDFTRRSQATNPLRRLSQSTLVRRAISNSR
jgi:hypothetical protein